MQIILPKEEIVLLDHQLNQHKNKIIFLQPIPHKHHQKINPYLHIILHLVLYQIVQVIQEESIYLVNI